MRVHYLSAFFCLLLVCSEVLTSHACTSFCFDTPGGPVFGVNLDLKTGDGHLFVNRRGIAKQGYVESTTGETAQWTSLYGNVTFNLVGRELPWGGMNEAGLVVSTMQLNVSQCPAPDERPPLAEASLVQYLLDTCCTVTEAILAVSRVRLSQDECASHYMVADESGECVAIEFLEGEFVHYSGTTLPVKALANAPYAAGVAYMETGAVPADNPGASVERVAGAAAKVQGYSPESDGSPVEFSFGILTETVVAPKKWWSNLFNEPYTRWNVVYDIARREVHFRTVDNPATRSLTLGSYDFSCKSPLLMLDVNAELEGNIDGRFGAYDHEANLEILQDFCEKWGLDVSNDRTLWLVEFFEGFECASENES